MTSISIDNEAWLEDLYALTSIRKRLQKIYFEFDELLWLDRFDEIDEIMSKVDFNKLDVSSIIGFLSITLSVKDSLKLRNDYLMRVKGHFENNNIDCIDERLSGLE